MAACPGCQREIVGQSKFCRYCGHPLTGEPAAATESVRENLPPGVLVRRVQPGEMQGLLTKTLEVEEGQAAMLLVGGRHDRTLGPGKHSIGSMLRSSVRSTSVVLFRAADVSIDISVARLLTSDPLPLDVSLRLVLKLDRPILVWQNLVRGADSYSTEHLASALYPLVEEGCQAFFGSRSVKDLDAHKGTRQELEMALASHLDQPLARWGTKLVSVQAVSIRCETWDKVSQARTSTFVAAADEEIALEGRKRLFDVHQESDIQALAQETAEVVGVEKRVAVWERLRRAIQANATNEIRSRAELEELVRQADKDRLLKESDYENLVRTLSEAKEDHKKGRAFVLRRVEAEGEYELQKLDLGHRFGLEQERLALELTTARQEMEARWELELRRVELEISKERGLAEARRERDAEERDTRSRSQIGDARTAAAIGDIERDQDAKDLEMALGAYSQYKDVKREDELARQRGELEAEERRLSMAVEAEGRRVEMRLKESREKHDYELRHIEALSGAGVEALIAISGPEQAQLLAQLARTRALSGSSPEQILALQAGESPQIASALKEILTATAASGQLEQYERLVDELKEGARLSREDYQRNVSTMSEMFNKALDSVKETAVAFSGQPSPQS